MPCLDEERTVGACVAQALQVLESHQIPGEVLVADNGSRDRSRAVAEAAGARVVAVEERGYGAALACGIEAARGRYVVMGDSDGSYDFGELPRILNKLREGHDLVLGNRFRGGIRTGAMPLSHRYLGNPALTAITKLFFRSPCGDVYCGLRGFRRDAVLGLALETVGMEFALEMVVKASIKGLSIGEVPVTLSPDGRDRPPHLRTWRDGWRSLRFLVSFSPSWMFLYPGQILAVAGLAVGAWILPASSRFGATEFDVRALIYCGAAVWLGVQLILFGLFFQHLAVALGLHARDRSRRPALGQRELNLGGLAGVLLIFVGIALGSEGTLEWTGSGLETIDPFRMRFVIPSAVALALGCQILFGSLLLNLPLIRRRARRGGMR
jgi:hypothetical protein